MKVIDDDNLKVTLELETRDGQYAFYAGKDDHRYWTRSPETSELSKYIQDNRKHAQIVVKCNDSYTRIK